MAIPADFNVVHPEHYAEHLAGKLGLGLVPVRRDGTCRFAAIDIDIDSIDHPALLQKVLARKLPLTVCRSKSGGAHLYLFMKEPGQSAATARPAAPMSQTPITRNVADVRRM